MHCIVWAKECFKLLFGSRAESMLNEPLDGPDKSVYMEAVLATPELVEEARGESEMRRQVQDYCKQVLVALFATEINKQLSMDKYKGAKHTPEPIDERTIHACCVCNDGTVVSPSISGSGWDRRIWTPEECIREISSCVSDIWLDPVQRAALGGLAFDKDDRIAMRFVTAASNLRSYVFKIPPQSFYDSKGIAGNIIPAIATTNAIVAGLQVVELLKILEGTQSPSTCCHYT